LKNKALSIIVPIYNCEATIEKCIDSILKSEFKNFEILIINDSSTDNSRNIIESRYLNKENVKIINLNKNEGVSFCRNLGIEIAQGEYITFVDSDDYINEKMYANMMSYIEKYDLDCCICDYLEIFSNGNVQKSKYSYSNRLLLREECINEYLIDNISPAVWDKIFKANILKENVKFNTKLKVGEDILFCLDFFYHANRIYTLNEVNYYYIQQEKSVMHVVSPKLLQFKDIVLNINEEELNYFKTTFHEEFNYFKSAMLMRGIHSLTVLYNKENKKEIINFLEVLADKNVLKLQLKSKYTNKFIKLEVFIINHLGIKIHLLMKPIYTGGRKFLRKL
jgi:glycosyltransferase involved in cell wall biosynthesis